MFITDDQFKKNENDVRKFIKTARDITLFINNESGKVMRIDKTDKVFINLLKKISKTRLSNGDVERGTAMFPKESLYWSIGSLGSMWADIRDDYGRLVRICFYGFEKTIHGVLPQFEIQLYAE